MGYRILYGSEIQDKSKTYNLRLQIMTCVFLLLFCLSARALWPEGTALLQNILISGQKSATEIAFLDLVDSLRSGIPAGEAITVFCRTVLENAR